MTWSEAKISAPVRAAFTVSIHALVRGRPSRTDGRIAGFQGFDPRPRERATESLRFPTSGAKVSIHALVRGRLPLGQSITFRVGGFDPRPRERATQDGVIVIAIPGGFDPRPRERATKHDYVFEGVQIVSIHALVRGRLAVGDTESVELEGFRSTPS